jgi:hypothetical protein
MSKTAVRDWEIRRLSQRGPASGTAQRPDFIELALIGRDDYDESEWVHITNPADRPDANQVADLGMCPGDTPVHSRTWGAVKSRWR